MVPGETVNTVIFDPIKEESAMLQHETVSHCVTPHTTDDRSILDVASTDDATSDPGVTSIRIGSVISIGKSSPGVTATDSVTTSSSGVTCDTQTVPIEDSVTMESREGDSVDHHMVPVSGACLVTAKGEHGRRSCKDESEQQQQQQEQLTSGSLSFHQITFSVVFM